MKNKKVLTISLIAAAVALASFACVAVIQAQKKEPPKETPLGESGLYTKKEEAPGPKVYAEGTANEKVLKYEKTMHLSDGQTMDIYLDAEGKQYRYDEAGVLKGITERSDDEVKSNADEIDEATAKKLSAEYGKELYGEEFEKFSYETYYIMATGTRYISYSKRYGEGGYILGPTISFMLKEDGELYNTNNLNSAEYDAFNAQKLTFKKADVDRFIEQEIKALNKGKETAYTVSKYQLKWEDGKYYLQIVVNYDEDTLREGPVLRYDIK